MANQDKSKNMSISELFKELSTNEIFLSYFNDNIEFKSESDILNDMLNNKELMLRLNSILDDEDIIKSKMQIKINQLNKQKNRNINNNEQHEKDKSFSSSSDSNQKNTYSDNEHFIPYYDNETQIAFLSPTVRIEPEGNIRKMICENFICYY
jgi:hypothetical protein